MPDVHQTVNIALILAICFWILVFQFFGCSVVRLVKLPLSDCRSPKTCKVEKFVMHYAEADPSFLIRGDLIQILGNYSKESSFCNIKKKKKIKRFHVLPLSSYNKFLYKPVYKNLLLRNKAFTYLILLCVCDFFFLKPKLNKFFLSFWHLFKLI